MTSDQFLALSNLTLKVVSGKVVSGVHEKRHNDVFCYKIDLQVAY